MEAESIPKPIPNLMERLQSIKFIVPKGGPNPWKKSEYMMNLVLRAKQSLDLLPFD